MFIIAGRIKETKLQKKLNLSLTGLMSAAKIKANFSYWELKHYFRTYDLIVIGSGIVGLSTALSYKQKNKKASVLILEKGMLPEGASTKNAGFACFGSVSELRDDLKKMPEKVVLETVKMRWEGLQLLRKRISDKEMDYQSWGGFEVFRDKLDYEQNAEHIDSLNLTVKDLLGHHNCYQLTSLRKTKIKTDFPSILNKYEGQLDTMKMMHALLQLVSRHKIDLLNNLRVSALSNHSWGVEVYTNTGTFKGRQVVVATNGFAAELLNLKDIEPARAQVLITKPIKKLHFNGAFHFDRGFYYFRNIHDRVLFGGGRNLDVKKEATSINQLNPKIQHQLHLYLKNFILPETPFEIEHRWTGIMGVGSEKKPIMEMVGKNTLAAVRMGGMGVAMGSLVGENAAKMLS